MSSIDTFLMLNAYQLISNILIQNPNYTNPNYLKFILFCIIIIIIIIIIISPVHKTTNIMGYSQDISEYKKRGVNCLNVECNHGECVDNGVNMHICVCDKGYEGRLRTQVTCDRCHVTC